MMKRFNVVARNGEVISVHTVSSIRGLLSLKGELVMELASFTALFGLERSERFAFKHSLSDGRELTVCPNHELREYAR